MSAHKITAKTVGSRIMTATGEYFDFLNPQTYKFDITAIAHSLSLQTRWTGNCRCFYSIAEHSVRASLLSSHQNALATLLHDAAESVTGDCSTPLKKLLKRFQEIEKATEIELFKQFDIKFPFDKEVKVCDLIMLATEKRDLMGDDSYWEMLEGISPSPKAIKPWSPNKAKKKFLERYEQLTENK